MTFPCIDEGEFEMVDGTHLRPRPYMAFRHVATNAATSVDWSGDPNGGNQAADLYQLQVAWTNPDPIGANVYALLTRGGSKLAVSCRNRLYIETFSGTALGVAPADPTAATSISKFGNGGDLGGPSGGSTILGAPCETRAGERASLVGNTVLVAPGQTYKVRVRLRVDAAFWETTAFYGGDSEMEMSLSTGATRLDLFAYPAF